LIRSEWEKKDSTFQIEVEIPHNTTTNLLLPTSEVKTVKINGNASDKWIADDKEEQDKVSLKLGSGIYLVQLGVDL